MSLAKQAKNQEHNPKENPKMEKDYKSFSSAAKSRFRKMAKELGYEQLTGILYVKKREGWYEAFSLQASSYGNPFFYINYGVKAIEHFPATREELLASGMIHMRRLRYQDEGAFPAGTKKEIEESAAYALKEYQRVALPWFKDYKLDQE